MGGKERLASQYMLLSVFLLSLFPVFFKLAGAENYPFLFNAFYNIASAIGCFSVIYFYNPEIYKKKGKDLQDFVLGSLFQFKDAPWRDKGGLHFILSIVGSFDYVLFALASSFIDYSVVSLLFEIWPVIFIYYAVFLFGDKKERQYPKISSVIYLLLAAVGISFVIFSNNESSIDIINNPNVILGGGIALLAAFITSMVSAHSLKWGVDCEKNFKEDDKDDDQRIFPEKGKEDKLPASALFSLFLSGVATAVMAIISAIIGLFLGEWGDLTNYAVSPQKIQEILFVVLVGAGVIQTSSKVFWRFSNMISTNLLINAMAYLTPIFAVAWIWIFFGIGIERLDYFIIGALAIIIANMLINFSADVRIGYKTLINALWLFGTVAYLFAGVQINADTYFNIIAIVTTMYILVLSFRLDRFVRRTSDEENRAFSLLENIDKCIALNLLKEDVRQLLKEINSSKSIAALLEYYDKMKQVLYNAKEEVSKKGNTPAIDRIAKIDNEIDALALSKQQGNNFGEMVAMAILGFITIAVSLVLYPVNICGVEGFTVKMFAMLLATIVMFLFANIVDLSNDRSSPIMEEDKTKSKGKWRLGIEFRDSKSRNSERWLSSIICIAIVAICGFGLWEKWVWVGGEFACQI